MIPLERLCRDRSLECAAKQKCDCECDDFLHIYHFCETESRPGLFVFSLQRLLATVLLVELPEHVSDYLVRGGEAVDWSVELCAGQDF